MSRRNSREGKARRRAERAARPGQDPYPQCDHITDGEDLSRCRWPGCGQRWTVQIRRPDGWTAFVCDEHARSVAEDPAGP